MDFSLFIQKLQTKIKIIFKVIRNIDDMIDELIYVIDLLEDKQSYADNISYVEVREEEDCC